MMLIKKTKSVCPECFLEISAEVLEEDDGHVYMSKKCPFHGEMKVLLEADPYVYSKLMNKDPCSTNLPPSCLMIPVTHKCNLNCKICYLPFHKFKDLSLKEIKRIAQKSEAPVIRISGGEPTLRKDLPEIIRYVTSLGKGHSLLTNGIRLEVESYVKKLVNAGLNNVHLSFNSLNDEDFLKIDGKPILDKKLKAFQNLKKHNIKIVLSTLIVRGVNENILKDMLSFYLSNHKAIIQWRIRSSIQIGKHTKVRHYSLSELLDLLCKAIGVDKKNLLKDYSKKKNNLSVPCSLEIGLFYYKNIEKYEFILAETNTYDLKKMTKSWFRKLYFGKKILRQRGLKWLFKYFLTRISEKGEVVFCNVKLRSWPSKYTIDLDDITYCPSRNLCEDLVIRPFCYGLILNEKKAT